MTRFRIVLKYPMDGVYPMRVTRYVVAKTKDDAIRALYLTKDELDLIESIDEREIDLTPKDTL